MKSIIIILISLFNINIASAQQKEIDALIQLNKEWINAYPMKDSAAMKRIFADDLILIGPNGKKFTKNDIITGLKNQTIKSATVDSASARLITNDVGIITAYITFTLTNDGKDVTGKNCYQDVYVKRKGKWQAISAHVTLLNMQ